MRFISLKRSGQAVALPMTSLIDVVFLLLIYFVVTARFAQTESELASGLQSDAPAAEATLPPVTVNVEASPPGQSVFRVGGRTVGSRRELAELLSLIDPGAGAAIRVSDAAPVSAAAAAWQAARDAGFEKVSYVPSN